MNVKRILVPVDFSACSDRAVDFALFLAEGFEASITLIHAVVLFQQEPEEGDHLAAYKAMVKGREAEVRRRLGSSRKRAAGSVPVESVLVRGISAADTILDYQTENPHDMIVIGTHGERGLRKWVFGSVAERVVRFSPIPVVTVHDLPDTLRMERILVPVDFSEASLAAVKRVHRLCERFDASPVFLHVLEPPLYPAYFSGDVGSVLNLHVPPPDPALFANRLREFVATVYPDPDTTVLEGRPYEEICRFAGERGCDAIFMATRGLGGLEHFLLGSTAERVVRLAPVPVFTVVRHRGGRGPRDRST